MGRDITPVQQGPERLDIDRPEPETDLGVLLHALHDVLTRAELFTEHRIERETLSVREHMSRILERLGNGDACAFVTLVETSEGRLGVVVSFLGDAVWGGIPSPTHTKNICFPKFRQANSQDFLEPHR